MKKIFNFIILISVLCIFTACGTAQSITTTTTGDAASTQSTTSTESTVSNSETENAASLLTEEEIMQAKHIELLQQKILGEYTLSDLKGTVETFIITEDAIIWDKEAKYEIQYINDYNTDFVDMPCLVLMGGSKIYPIVETDDGKIFIVTELGKNKPAFRLVDIENEINKAWSSLVGEYYCIDSKTNLSIFDDLTAKTLEHGYYEISFEVFPGWNLETDSPQFYFNTDNDNYRSFLLTYDNVDTVFAGDTVYRRIDSIEHVSIDASNFFDYFEVDTEIKLLEEVRNEWDELKGINIRTFAIVLKEEYSKRYIPGISVVKLEGTLSGKEYNKTIISYDTSDNSIDVDLKSKNPEKFDITMTFTYLPNSGSGYFMEDRTFMAHFYYNKGSVYYDDRTPYYSDYQSFEPLRSETVLYFE